MSIPYLPAELFFTIASNFENTHSLQDLNSFLRATRQLYHFLNPSLYKLGAHLSNLQTGYPKPHQESPLEWAIERSQETTLKLLLQHGVTADTRLRGVFGPFRRRSPAIAYSPTPLLKVVTRGEETLVRILIDSGGVNVNLYTTGETPLHIAAKHGFHGIVALLLLASADIDAKARGSLETPLLAATREGRVETVRVLLKNGADVAAVDAGGRTALHIAATREGQVGIVRALLESGADVAAVDVCGRTALHIAAARDDVEVIRMLVQFGADTSPIVSASSRLLRTPLQFFGQVRECAWNAGDGDADGIFELLSDG